jgi:hypothetical protein
MPPPIVYVRWLDAYHLSEGNVTRDHITDGFALDSVGWLVKETKRSISIGQDYSEEQDDFRRVITIPRKMIVSVKKIEP